MIYRFGNYNIDTSVYELRFNGELVSIEPQVFNLLVHLIENRDRIVSKDDLISAIWQDRPISDAALSSGIFAARRAVGDTGEAQAIIQTITRRGFRFVGSVIAESPDDPVAIQLSDKLPPLDTSERVANSDAVPGGSALKTMKLDGFPETTIPILAVLPFKNLSTDLDEYFCDGLTEDIIANLTYFRELRVIASNSSFRFKDRNTSLSQLAAKLNADYIVDGSVRHAGDKLRITVQLIDASTGFSIWADQYNRTMEDIFAVQDEATRMIVASLGVKMQDAALSRALKKSPAEFDAYDCLLRARRYTSTLSAKMHFEARDLLEKAIELDNTYADAYALLANVYLAEHRFEANPRPDSIDRALKMAQTATRLDPQNAYAHCWLAIVHFFLGENDKFEAEAIRALILNPNDPEILADIGHYLSFMGEFERGYELSNQAQKLNPLHPGWYHFCSARYNYDKYLYEDMLVDVRRISMPKFYWTHLLNAAALGQLGRSEAGLSLKKMFDLMPNRSAEAELRKWNASPPDFEHIMDGLRKAGL